MLKNKKFKILLLNILLIIFFALLTEFYCSLISYKFHLTQVNPEYLNKFSAKTYVEDYKNQLLQQYYFLFNSFKNVHQKFSKYFDTNKFRKIAFSNDPNASNIVLFGCSYTYGSHLEDNQAFHSKLSKYWNKNVYNYGIEAGSPREILYLLKNWEFLPQKPPKNEVEYVIYTFIEDHARRLFVNLRPNVPNFKIIDEKLKHTSSHLDFYKMTYTYYYANNFIFNKFLHKNANKILALYINEINNEIKKNFSNGKKETKFILFIYRNWDSSLKEIRNLNIDGMIVVNLEDITNIDITKKQYQMHDDHPNETAWDIIVPALAEEIELKTR